MARSSAGLLLFRHRAEVPAVEVLLVHPGGPFWKNKQAGAWSIPKGEFEPDLEDPRKAAAREFEEELGSPPPPEPWIELGETRLKSGKRILAWAVEGDLATDQIVSATFDMEWPPRSGRRIDVPEVDEARWVQPVVAAELLNPAQVCFVERLLRALVPEQLGE